MKRNILSVAVVLGMASLGAHAQEQETSAPAGQQVQATTLDGVTVTARRRTESIQDVPVAVSAFGEEQLRDLQAQDVSGLQGAVPNLNIVPGRGSSNTVNVFIRGIGQPDSLQTFDPGVGMYVDDVYYLHEHVPFSPDWSARIALQHGFDLGGNGTLTVGGDVADRGDTWLSVDNRPGLMQDAYTTAGLFSAWDSPQYAWQIRAGVRNLTDELYKVEGQEFSSVANIQTAYYAPPRNWYLTVRRNFF